MLRQAEELVAEVRLDQIARDHRSIGSILDNRQLHNLEEVRFQKRGLRLEVEKRIQGRRGGRLDVDIKSIASSAVDAFRERGEGGPLKDSFDLEERIWRNKSCKQSYSDRRRFQYPELEDFIRSMNAQQRIDYKKRCFQALVKLVEKYRKECRELKDEMDLNGIFHPEANCQRVHCIYLMKLQKGVSSDSIEEPVLKQMYREEYERQLHELDTAITKEKMMKELESQEIHSTKKFGISSGESMTPKHVEEITDFSELTAKIVKLKPFQERVSDKRDLSASRHEPKKILRKSKSAETMSRLVKLEPLTKVAMPEQTRAKSKKLSVIIDEGRNTFEGEEDSATKESSSQLSANKVGGTGGTSSPLKAINKRLRNERLGYLESRSVLPDEASRLDGAETVYFKRGYDKNGVLDDSLSSWMLNEIQKQEIHKTASGGVNANRSTIGHGTTLATIHGDSIASVTNVDLFATPGSYSPQKLLPFDEFYSIIKSYSGTAGHDNQAASSSRPSSAARRGGKLAEDEEEETDGKVVDREALHRGEAVEEADRLSTPDPVNIVKHLMEKDKHFDAYLKMSERELPSSKLMNKLNANITKPKKSRRTAPLGKEAVLLTDSRGKVSKLANKGFPNVFASKERSSEEVASDAKRGIVLHKTVESDNFDKADIVERLHADDDDHNDAPSGHRLASVDPRRGMNGSPKKYPLYHNRSKSAPHDPNALKQEAVCFLKQELGDDFEGEFQFNEVADVDMQSKLLATWESLQVTMQDRLFFMDKYSSFAYAAEMSRAVDMWADVAVLVVAVREMYHLFKKYQEGLVIFPLHSSKLVKFALRKIHPLLATSVASLIPPCIQYDDNVQTVPLSASSVVEIRSIIKESVRSRNFDKEQEEDQVIIDANVILSHDDGKLVFIDALHKLVFGLRNSLNRAHRELEDSVPYLNGSVKEWLLSLDLPRSPRS